MTRKMKIDEILFSEEQIKETVNKLAEQINNDYAGEELIVVGILKGCFVFVSDLVRRLQGDVQIHFMQVSSYGSGTESSGTIKIKKDLNVDIQGKHVLIAEDIVDSGNTLYQLLPILKERKPASVKVCSLLSKPSRRQVDYNPDYIGFEIPDKFIVGYGLDCDERFRQLPYIAVVKVEDAE